MPAATPSDTDADRLDTLRRHLHAIDPDCELSIDPDSGELRVRGDFDATQLEAALRLSGIGWRIDGPGCCGGCGCG